jgi:hypothetical protein
VKNEDLTRTNLRDRGKRSIAGFFLVAVMIMQGYLSYIAIPISCDNGNNYNLRIPIEMT